jgi:hypothetical protein
LKRFKTGEFQGALEKKGFRSERKSSHWVYYFYDEDNRKTHIFTKVSHGRSEDIGNPLMKFLKIQLFLDNNEMANFIECPMDYAQYLALLRRKGVLTVQPHQSDTTPATRPRRPRQ